jgi:hypothetical protein
MSDQYVNSLEALVWPVGWNDDGDVSMAALLTYDEREYLVADDFVGRELLRSARQRVSVDGSLASDFRGKPVIKVTRFAKLAS